MIALMLRAPADSGRRSSFACSALAAVQAKPPQRARTSASSGMWWGGCQPSAIALVARVEPRLTDLAGMMSRSAAKNPATAIPSGTGSGRCSRRVPAHEFSVERDPSAIRTTVPRRRRIATRLRCILSSAALAMTSAMERRRPLEPKPCRTHAHADRETVRARRYPSLARNRMQPFGIEPVTQDQAMKRTSQHWIRPRSLVR